MQSEAFGTVAPTDLKQSFNSIADTVVTDHRQSIMAQLRAKQVRAKHPPVCVFPLPTQVAEEESDRLRRVLQHVREENQQLHAELAAQRTERALFAQVCE